MRLQKIIAHSMMALLTNLSLHEMAFAGQVEIRTCNKAHAAEKPGSIIRPKTIPQRVIKNKFIIMPLLQKHFIKPKAQTQEEAPAPIEPSPMAAAPAPIEIKSETHPTEPAQPVKAASGFGKKIENLAIDGDHMSFPYEPRNPITGIEWFNSEKFFLREASASKIGHAYLQKSTLIDREEKELHQTQIVEFPEKHFSQKYDYVVLRDANEYRIVEKVQGSKPARPLIKGRDLELHGRFLIYTRDNGERILTSVHPSDFEKAGDEPVERTLPHEEILGVSSNGEVIQTATQWMRYNNADSSYEPYPFAEKSKEFPAPVGSPYVVFEVAPLTWKIGSKNGHYREPITIDKYSLGRKYNIANLRGEVEEVLHNPYRSSVTALIALYDITAPYPQNLKPVEVVLTEALINLPEPIRDFEGYDGYQRLGDEYLLLRKSNHGQVLNADPTLLKSTQHPTPDMAPRPQIPNLRPELTTMMDADRFVQFFEVKIGSRPGFKVVTTNRRNGQTHNPITGPGTAFVLPNTTILQIENGNKISFFDLRDEEVLWEGLNSELPSVSPNGEYVAYFQNDQVHVKRLGQVLKSRRAF